MSEIRTLLANAQAAELRGEKPEAARLLREAASWYRDRQQLRRAAQMLRQARRVEGIEEEPDAVFGFGAEFEGDAVPPPEPLPEVAQPTPTRQLVEQRGPQLADPAVDAWCSFCCRPKTEVGPLVAGPAGAFVCQGCTERSTSLLPGARPAAPSLAQELPALLHELPAQRRARERFLRLRARLSLVIGPPGSGKSAWLATLRGPDVRHLELEDRLSTSDERELLAWLEAPARSAFLVVRAEVPTPALVLQGEHGPEPIHDTATLADAVPQVSPALLARVDAVHAFEAPEASALHGLGRAVAAARGLVLPDAALEHLVALSLRAGRGAHELVTLLARIPPGTYGV